jgi:hypothetical protein
MFLKYSPEIFEDFAWRYISVNKPKDFHKKTIATPNHTPWLSPKIGKLPSNQLGLLIPGWIWSNLSKKSRKNLMLLPVFSASGVSLRFTVLLKRLGLRDVGRIKERSLDFRSLFFFGRESPILDVGIDMFRVSCLFYFCCSITQRSLSFSSQRSPSLKSFDQGWSAV